MDLRFLNLEEDSFRIIDKVGIWCCVPRCEKTLGFTTRFDTNWAVQPQKMARGLKFQI